MGTAPHKAARSTTSGSVQRALPTRAVRRWISRRACERVCCDALRISLCTWNKQSSNTQRARDSFANLSGDDGAAASASDAATDGAADAVAEASDTAGKDEAEEAPIPDGAMMITAGVGDIRKMTVTCGGGFRESGTGAVLVPAGTEAPCKVGVILNTRLRLRTTIESHTPGKLVCFADGSDGCAPE